MSKYFLSLLILVISSLLTTSCAGIDFSTWHFPYMMNVQQGNYITTTQLKQLKLGMTKEQVVYALGSNPVSQYMFKQDSWQFIYQDYANEKLKKSYTINLNFDTLGKLINIKKDGEVFSE